MRSVNVLAAAVVLAIGSPAAASVVFSNGTPNGQGGQIVTGEVNADDFTLTNAILITGAGIYVGKRQVGDSPASDPFVYYIWADASGAPGALLTFGSVVPASVTDTGISWSAVTPRDAFLITFNLTSPFAAAAGTTYWFGISDPTTGSDGIWALSNSQGNSQFSPNGADFWQASQGETAFYLEGGSAGVPEPSSWAMMLLGFGAIGIGLRRNPKRFLTA